MKKGIEIFLSYAHEDEALRDELVKQLSEWKRQGLISIWHDRDINAGTEWQREVDTHLNTAQIILLLISPDFMASDYCNSLEAQQAMKRHEAGAAHVIPIILRPVHWRDAPFGKLQALPRDAKPVTTWSNRDQAFYDIAKGIQGAVEQAKLPIGKDEIRTLTQPFAVETTSGMRPGGIDKKLHNSPSISSKKRAILDRRLVTEIAALFSLFSEERYGDPRTLTLLQFGLGMFDQLIVQSQYGSTLASIMQKEKEILESSIVFYQPPKKQRRGEYLTIEDAGDVWSENPEFRLAASRYDRSKGSSMGNAEENALYLQQTLQLAKDLDAAIIPHPDRWSLYRCWFRHCIWAAGDTLPEKVSVLHQEELITSRHMPEVRRKRLTKFSSKFPEAIRGSVAMIHYGLLQFPFPVELLEHYDLEYLERFQPFLYEFCIPLPTYTSLEEA